ncbi:hypothetical protein [Brevibacillus dissolubilis]|uniref:hypothetical protein n=1 Tax=Brevibacillus dissolubilis TaxID=1844116 RepID=UPI0011179809|nr:hypothetical protein [Brevibacillus dissolubilis]
MNHNALGFNPIEQKKQMVRDLVALIDKVPDNDNPHSIRQFIAYLNGLLRTKGVVPPTTEIMTIIKQQKPQLYHATRLNLTSSSHLQILFQITMDPALAASRLQEFVKKQ